MASISSKHDKFVRKILSDTDTAIDYLQNALPVHIAEKLDFNTLARQPGSYVSKELEKTISDVVYTCRRKDRSGDMEISLLLEHKSSPDIYTPVQIGSYLFSGYQHQIKQKRKQLSPIIPILLYHGKEKWEYWTLDRLFDELDGELLGYIPRYDYIYHNITDWPEEDIKAVHNRFLVSFFLMLKYAWDKSRLKANLPEILAIGLAKGSEHQQIAVLVYSFELVDFTEEQIKEILEAIPMDTEEKEKFVSTYDRLLEKSRKEVWAKAAALIEQERAKAEQERAKMEQERAKTERKAYVEKLKSALEFKKLGLPVPDIARGLQLPIEVVEKL